MEIKNEWFSEWFNTPYYRELYAHRSNEEASEFISKLIKILPQAPCEVLDVCCGNGRHSAVFESKGYSVFGIDISSKSIEEANDRGLTNASFAIADARDFTLDREFCIAVNLFTSFGYFQTREEHVNMLKRIYSHLRPNGYLVLDFFNAKLVRAAGDSHVVKEGQGNTYTIDKRITNDRVEKSIHISSEGKSIQFNESVALFSQSELLDMAQEAGFSNIQLFGAYDLSEFNESGSDRCILVANK